MNRDAEHLDLLAVFHYVVAGLGALCSMIPLIHFFLGLGLATGQLEGDDPVAQKVGVFFVIIATCLILAGLTVSVLVVFAGRFLKQRRRYTYCLVIAAILCLMMPFGTVLGVFTIIVLMRDSVRGMFGVAYDDAPVAEAGP